MGSRAQSTVDGIPELRFLQFSVAQVHVGLRKQFINNFVFPTWAYAAGFNNNNNECGDNNKSDDRFIRVDDWCGAENPAPHKRHHLSVVTAQQTTPVPQE